MINERDLCMDVGISAYEKFTGKKVNRDKIKTYEDREEYRYGVLLIHIPTGKSVYSNLQRSQIGNKNDALKTLEKLITGWM